MSPRPRWLGGRRPPRRWLCSTILDDHDDVQEVYANFDISEEVMAKLGK
jgi:hypothetical protein